MVLLLLPGSQEVLWHAALHLCDARALWRGVVKLDDLVVHVLVNVHNRCLVAAPVQPQHNNTTTHTHIHRQTQGGKVVGNCRQQVSRPASQHL